MKIKKNKKAIIFFIIALVFVIILFMLFNKILDNSKKVVEKENKKAEIVELKKEENKIEEVKKETEKKVTTTKKETTVKKFTTNKSNSSNHYTTRLTSFWPSENHGENNCTASGLCKQHMTANENGWYMYQGRLAIATASTRLGSSKQKTYKLFQKVTLVIKGKSYPAIVVDVCGACQKKNIIDLYVKDGKHSITTTAEIYY